MLTTIAEALSCGVEELLYGPAPAAPRQISRRRLVIGGLLTLLAAILAAIAWWADRALSVYLILSPRLLLQSWFLPWLFLLLGWTLLQVCGAASLTRPRPHRLRWVVLAVTAAYFLLTLPLVCQLVINTLDFWRWFSSGVGGSYSSSARLPGVLQDLYSWFCLPLLRVPWVFLFPGGLLWMLGFPAAKIESDS